MNKNRSQNILLVEIMIAVLFFALCSTVILEVFVTAKEYSRQSSVESQALIEIQDVSERIYAAQGSDEKLTDMGFEFKEDRWEKECDEYTLELTLKEEDTESGIVRSWQISVLRGGKTVMQIPGARYIPGGEAQ